MLRITQFSTLKILLLAWLFISLLGGLETVLIFFFKPEVIQSNKLYWLPLMRIVNGYAAIALVLYPGHHFLKKKNLSSKILGYFILLIFFVLVYLSVSVTQFQLAFLSINASLFFAGIGETLMTDLHHIASYYFLLLFIILGKEYFEERTTALIKKEQLENELSKTQLIVLQRQIQPHFLFNTLNNVVSIIDERKESAQEMLLDLSDLLRISMEMDFTKQIPLMKEVEILRSYLSIEKKRFEHQLSFSFEITKDCESKLVPPFLLQPLVENAIKHGFKGKIKKLSIEINALLEDDYLKIVVENNGAPLKDSSMGIGLINCKERLENAYGENFVFSLLQDNGQVINLIKIPVNEATSDHS